MQHLVTTIIDDLSTVIFGKQQQIKFDEKNNARWFCDKCNQNIRIPNPSELEDWIKR